MASQGARRGSTPEFPCGDCKKEVKKTHKGLLCGLCDRWYHSSCQNVSEQLYEGLCKDNNKDRPQAHSHCEPTCNTLAHKFIKNLARLEMKVEQLTGTLNDVDDRVKQIEEGNFTERMLEIIKETKGKGNQGETAAFEKEEVEKIIKSQTKEQLAEVENRTKRQANLMIFKLPESKRVNEAQKNFDDARIVKEILEEIGAKNDPKDIRRLSSKGINSADKKDRPIRVIFQSQSDRDEALKLMRNAKKDLIAREITDQTLSTIYFRKDMTPMERREDEELYKLLKKKREESKKSGDDNAKWVMRNGRIVNLHQKPSNREESEK